MEQQFNYPKIDDKYQLVANEILQHPKFKRHIGDNPKPEPIEELLNNETALAIYEMIQLKQSVTPTDIEDMVNIELSFYMTLMDINDRLFEHVDKRLAIFVSIPEKSPIIVVYGQAVFPIDTDKFKLRWVIPQYHDHETGEYKQIGGLANVAMTEPLRKKYADEIGKLERREISIHDFLNCIEDDLILPS